MLVQQLAAQGVTSIATLAADDNLHGLLAQISAVVASSVSRDETALALVNKIFKRAFEQHSSANGAAARLHTQVNVQLICRIHAVCPKVARFVTEMTLYSDAERTLPVLHDLSAEIKTQQPSAVPVVAPLKGEPRATFKTLEKYGGDYSRLTDLARMCAALLPGAPSVPDPPPTRAPTHLRPPLS